MILALDPGMSLGWALGEHLHDPTFGTVYLNGYEGARRSDSRGGLYAHLDATLRAMEQAHGRPTVVAFELPLGLRGRAAQRITWGVVAVIERVAFEWESEVVTVTPSELKREATGKGNAKKPAIVAAARRLWGVAVQTDHEADALFVYQLAAARRRNGG